MLNFFKNFGKGVLYVLVLPFLLVGMALYGVFALFVFIFLAIKSLILFFTGRSLYEDLPEDKEAKKRLAIANGTYVPEEETREPKTQTATYTQESTPVEKDPFYIPDYLKTDEERELSQQSNQTSLDDFIAQNQQQEPTPEPVREQEPAPQFEPEPEVQETPKEDIIMQKNTQNSAFLDINDEEGDNDDDDSGIKIDYE